MADLNFLNNPLSTGGALPAATDAAGGAVDPLANAPVFPAGTTTGSTAPGAADTSNFFNFATPNTIAPGTAASGGAAPTTPTAATPADGLQTGADGSQTGIVPPGTPAAGGSTGTGNFFAFQPPSVNSAGTPQQPVGMNGVQTATTGGNMFGFQSFAVPSITQPTIPIGVPNANLTPAFQGPGPIATANGMPSNVSMGGGNIMNVGNGIAGGSVAQPNGGTGGIAAPAASGGPTGGLTELSRADATDVGSADLTPADLGLLDGINV